MINQELLDAVAEAVRQVTECQVCILGQWAYKAAKLRQT